MLAHTLTVCSDSNIKVPSLQLCFRPGLSLSQRLGSSFSVTSRTKPSIFVPRACGCVQLVTGTVAHLPTETAVVLLKRCWTGILSECLARSCSWPRLCCCCFIWGKKMQACVFLPSHSVSKQNILVLFSSRPLKGSHGVQKDISSSFNPAHITGKPPGILSLLLVNQNFDLPTSNM